MLLECVGSDHAEHGVHRCEKVIDLLVGEFSAVCHGQSENPKPGICFHQGCCQDVNHNVCPA